MATWRKANSDKIQNYMRKANAKNENEGMAANKISYFKILYEPFKVFPANIKLLMLMHKKPNSLAHHSLERKNPFSWVKYSKIHERWGG
jgi:hypothetical protein